MNNFIEEIRKQLGSAPSPSDLIPGKWIRFSTNGRPSDRSGSCFLFLDMEGGFFVDWRMGNSGTWQAREHKTLAEKSAFAERVKAARIEAERQEEERRAQCGQQSEVMWSHGCDASGHPYLLRKNVKPYGVKQLDEELLIPVRDSEGNLHGLQKINPDGDKRFEPGTAVKGHLHQIGIPQEEILIAEGYATAATLHEETGLAAVCAFNAGNLKAVALEIWKKYPDVKITICADDDYATEGNPGLTKATEAAKAINGYLAVPVFPEGRGQRDSDFNDLARLAGPETVWACIAAAAKPQEDGSAEQCHEDQDSTFDAVIQRLAALSPLEYDRVRKEEARNLGVRPVTLDAAVKAAQKGEADDDQPFAVVEPWPEPVNPPQLLTDISKVIRRFIVCMQETAFAVALWVALTWFIDVVQIAPLAIITAPEKRCGKSLLLSLIGKLAARAVTASNISPAALYRTIEAWSPTLLIDEADAFLKNNEELRGILNSGHTRDSAYVIRCEGDDSKPTKFSTWGPKVISGIGHVADTLMDRAVVLELRRKLPHEKVERIRYAEPRLFDDLRAKLARFAEDYSEQVRQARPPLPESLNDRAQDNWEPLLQIAMVASEEWLQIATSAALKLSGDETVTLTIGTELLADIQDVFETKRIDRISTADLITALCADDEKPWATYSKGKPMNPKQLARRLKDYGIQSKSVRIGNEVVKGFKQEQFEDAFSRYVRSEKNISSNSPDFSGYRLQPAPILGLRDFSKVTQEDIVTDEKQRKPAPILSCNRVTGKNTLLGEEKIFQEKQASQFDLFKINVPVEVLR